MRQQTQEAEEAEIIRDVWWIRGMLTIIGCPRV